MQLHVGRQLLDHVTLQKEFGTIIALSEKAGKGIWHLSLRVSRGQVPASPQRNVTHRLTSGRGFTYFLLKWNSTFWNVS